MPPCVLHAEDTVPSQHGLSDQMEEAAKEWFSAGPHDKVNFEVNLMVAPGPLGEPLQHIRRACCLACLACMSCADDVQDLTKACKCQSTCGPAVDRRLG